VSDVSIMGSRHLTSRKRASGSTGEKEGNGETSRAYQLEMLQSSLNKNVIVVVCSSNLDQVYMTKYPYRWTLAAAKRMCMFAVPDYC
jgi:hypothetical protein